MRLVQVYYMSVNKTGAIQLLLWPVSWLPDAYFLAIIEFFLAMRYLKCSKFSEMKNQTVNAPDDASKEPRHRASDKKLGKGHPSVHPT